MAGADYPEEGTLGNWGTALSAERFILQPEGQTHRRTSRRSAEQDISVGNVVPGIENSVKRTTVRLVGKCPES
jgi:hypothetical protein